ncbi:MAG: hypothetical protein QW040_00415 [Candidatus Aenigmatarchaeota archaeon]
MWKKRTLLPFLFILILLVFTKEAKAQSLIDWLKNLLFPSIPYTITGGQTFTTCSGYADAFSCIGAGCWWYECWMNKGCFEGGYCSWPCTCYKSFSEYCRILSESDCKTGSYSKCCYLYGNPGICVAVEECTCERGSCKEIYCGGKVCSSGEKCCSYSQESVKQYECYDPKYNFCDPERGVVPCSISYNFILSGMDTCEIFFEASSNCEGRKIEVKDTKTGEIKFSSFTPLSMRKNWEVSIGSYNYDVFVDGVKYGSSGQLICSSSGYPTTLSQWVEPQSPSQQGTLISFYCSYYDKITGKGIGDADCKVYINNIPYPTNYISELEKPSYRYQTSTLSPGTYDWYCLCSKSGYETKKGNIESYTIAPPPSYSVTFSQSGIPFGVLWGVKVGGIRYTSTSSSITVSGLSGVVNYEYDSIVSNTTGTQYICTASCSGSLSSSDNKIASYKTQYYLQMSVNPSMGGKTSPQSGWYDMGSSITISATPNPGYIFSGWTCSGSGCYSGTLSSATITINNPINEIANFLDCGRANPSISITPSSQSSSAGKTLTYTVSVKNNDNSICGSSSFDLLVTYCPSGWSCSLSSSSLTISPGSTNSLTISVTSIPTTSPGTYTFKVKVTNSEATSYYGESTGSYIVITSPPPSCTFSLNSFSLTPDSVSTCPSTIKASITYSSSNCGSQVVSIRMNSCSGQEVATISTSDGSTSSSTTFVVTSNSNAGTYYACYGNQERSVKLSVSCPITTTLPTTTTTAPTLPTGIQCEECYARSECECTLTTACQNGLWMLQNKEAKPLSSTITLQLPPTTIQFEPNASGKILITALCFKDSKIETTQYTLEVKEPFLECDKNCEVLKPCTCRVRGCSDGRFSAVLGTTLLKWREKIDTKDFATSFISDKTGVVEVSVVCYNPVVHVEREIVIGGKIEPRKTFSLSNFHLTSLDSSYRIKLDYSNKFEEEVVIVLTLNKNGKAVNKKYVAPIGEGTASYLIDCKELGSGKYLISWKAFKASDTKNPILWSKLGEMRNITC